MIIEHIDISQSLGNLDIFPFCCSINGKKETIQGGSFVIAATESKNMVKTFRLGLCGPEACWVYMPNKLPGRNITKMQLFKGKELLENGVDYILDKQGALCSTEQELAPFKVKAEFTFLPERYDSIFLNTKTKKLEILTGEERDIDAEEYVPAIPNNCRRLFNIVATGENLYVIPAYNNPVSFQTKHLGRLKGKLEKGNEIKLLGYGDSITALQYGKRQRYSPNGKRRDCFKQYFNRYPKDTINKKIEKINLNDGSGNIHCKMGWNWALANSLEAEFDVRVNYLNCAIGGTWSGDSETQGLFPARIKKALKLKPDIVVLAFGMNELGMNCTYQNMTLIINQFKEVGADIIIMGVPQINGTRSKRDHDAWQKTNSILAKVAKEQNSLFIDTRKVNLGLKPEHICSANIYNHPGLNELKTYGQVLYGQVLSSLRSRDSL